MIITPKHVLEHLGKVTDEMIGKAHKIIDEINGNYFLVENSEGRLNAAGEIEEYKVTFALGKGFSCTCKSGQEGFANVRHASGVCWHVRASVACEQEIRQAIAVLELEVLAAKTAAAAKPEPIYAKMANPDDERQYMTVDGKPIDDTTYEAVMTATPKKTSKRQKGYSPKPFAILK